MKNTSWYVIVPILLMLYHLSGIYFIAYPVDPESDVFPSYSSGMFMGSMFLYMILNAIIAYIVYLYKESTGLMVVHIVYVGYILLMIDSSPDSVIYMFGELIQLVLDVLALVYALQVANVKLRSWFKLFTISVLIETVVAIFLPVFLGSTLLGIVNTALSLVVAGILIKFFMELKNIGPDKEGPSEKEPGDLLSRDDLK